LHTYLQDMRVDQHAGLLARPILYVKCWTFRDMFAGLIRVKSSC